MSAIGIGARKDAHLALCAESDVEARTSTLLDEVHLMHEALPELAVADVDPSLELFGRTLLLPIVISGMTGGTERAGAVNRALATAAQKFGLGMGVGSQRAMLENPELEDTYRVRDVAPDILLLANIGAVQARDAGIERVAALVERIGADALCVHLNVAQELVQDEGDRDFRGCAETIAELAHELPYPVVAKETGCGMSPRTLAALHAAGIRFVDVSGAGGTTWTGVEALRGSARQQRLGAELREWGIPTAASVVYARSAGLVPIASGGVRGSLDALRAIALGAEAAGIALPFLRAHERDAAAGVLDEAAALGEGIRAGLVLTGSRNLAELRRAPRVLGPNLRGWVAETEPGLGQPAAGAWRVARSRDGSPE